MAAKKAGVKRFIYASSSSVYGVSDSPTSPRTIRWCRSRSTTSTRACASRCCSSTQSTNFTGVIIRPATLCGYAPRQRLDLSVNILTNHAVNAGKITVFGGSQMRPNLHIQDMLRRCTSCCSRCPTTRSPDETFNAGYPEPVASWRSPSWSSAWCSEELPEQGRRSTIVTTPTDDIRSYHINSDKITRVLGFEPQAHHRGRGPRPVQGVQGRQAAEQHGGRPLLQRPPAEESSRRHERASPIAVVTGGAGFIGSHMVDLLLERGLRGARDRQPGRRPPQNLAHHKGNPRSRLLLAATSAQLEPDSPIFAGAQYVFHFAGIGDIVPSIERPMEYMSANVQGTVHVLECARARAASRSSSMRPRRPATGSPPMPTREDHPIAPQYPYALTKYQGEQAVFHWHQVYRLPVELDPHLQRLRHRASRTTGAYGAVFGVFLRQKLAGKPFTVVGDGTQRRDFLYVTDVAQAFLAAAETPISGERF